MNQLHFPLSLERILYTVSLFVCTIHKKHSAKGHQWPHFTWGSYVHLSLKRTFFQTLEAFGHYLGGSFTVPSFGSFSHLIHKYSWTRRNQCLAHFYFSLYDFSTTSVEILNDFLLPTMSSKKTIELQ